MLGDTLCFQLFLNVDLHCFIAILQSCPKSFNTLFMAFNYNEVKQLDSKNGDKTC